MPGAVSAIDKSSVHKICSGQVILDLATSVKEVVENALDANATSVEARLRSNLAHTSGYQHRSPLNVQAVAMPSTHALTCAYGADQAEGVRV
jgi:hypothetical protein